MIHDGIDHLSSGINISFSLAQLIATLNVSKVIESGVWQDEGVLPARNILSLSFPRHPICCWIGKGIPAPTHLNYILTQVEVESFRDLSDSPLSTKYTAPCIVIFHFCLYITLVENVSIFLIHNVLGNFNLLNYSIKYFFHTNWEAMSLWFVTIYFSMYSYIVSTQRLKYVCKLKDKTKTRMHKATICKWSIVSSRCSVIEWPAQILKWSATSR